MVMRTWTLGNIGCNRGFVALAGTKVSENIALSCEGQGHTLADTTAGKSQPPRHYLQVAAHQAAHAGAPAGGFPQVGRGARGQCPPVEHRTDTPGSQQEAHAHTCGNQVRVMPPQRECKNVSTKEHIHMGLW